MDRVDLMLCMSLLANSRRTYRELAEGVDSSVNAVHKRIQAMVDSGMIRRFFTRVTVPYAGASPIMVHGQLERPLTEPMRDAAGALPEVNWVGEACGNIIYLTGYLRGPQDMGHFVSSVQAVLPLRRPQVGVAFLPPPGDRLPLTRLDKAIVASLRDDSRKRVADIASEVNASAKTVGRRLERMIQGGVLEFSMEWYPDVSSDIFAYAQLELEREPYPLMMELQAMFPRVLFCNPFSNEPRSLLCMLWGNTTKEIKETRAELAAIKGVTSVTPNIIISGRIYRTWLDDLP
jgi:DNA-binding Lrp family transcriptional regulator